MRGRYKAANKAQLQLEEAQNLPAGLTQSPSLKVVIAFAIY